MKTIRLHISGIGRYDDVSPFIVTDNKLELKIELPNLNGEFYLVTDVNGTKNKLRLPSDGVITLDGLSAGELQAEVKHYLKGGLIKKYRVESRIRIEVDGALSGIPEITALNAEISELKDELDKANQSLSEQSAELAGLKKWVEAQKTILKEQEDKINALIKFAYTDYNASVYLKGGDETAFAEEFGFNPEDIKNGGQNNE